MLNICIIIITYNWEISPIGQFFLLLNEYDITVIHLVPSWAQAPQHRVASNQQLTLQRGI